MSKRILTDEQSFGNNAGDSSGNGEQSKRNADEKKHAFLKFQERINKLLTCDRMVKIEVRCPSYTKEELAKKLGISEKELEKLKKFYFYKIMESKIVRPLLNLYCSTKWAENGCKSK
ncbi:conserved hypothetical protein [Gammaproteobacteria bacterium]